MRVEDLDLQVLWTGAWSCVSDFSRILGRVGVLEGFMVVCMNLKALIVQRNCEARR